MGRFLLGIDAQEFLNYVLNSLHNDFLQLSKLLNGVRAQPAELTREESTQEDEWEEVGSGHKSRVIAARVNLEASPIAR